MEPRECFDDLLFRKLLLVTTLDKQSKTFQYNFDMMPDVYACLLTTRTLSFCPISLRGLWFEALKSGANLRQRLGGRAGLRRPRLNTQVPGERRLCFQDIPKGSNNAG